MTLTTELKEQLFGQISNDPFIMLVTLSSDDFSTLYFANNTEEIVSRGNTYQAFPMSIILPTDDGQSVREVSISFDNVALEIIDELRSTIKPINCIVEAVLYSDPDTVQYSIEELKIRDISYNVNTIEAKLYLDDFLNTEMTSERYTPTIYPGIF